MKRVISLFLGFMIAVSSIAYASVTEQTKEIDISFATDFSADTIGALPLMGSSFPKSNKMEVVAEENTSNKLLRYEVVDTGSDMYYEYNPNDINDYFITEFDINIELFGNGRLLFCFKDSKNSERAIMQIKANGDVYAADNSIVAKLVTGKTYKICTVLSLKDGKTDIYIDQRKKSSGIPIQGDFDGVSKFRMHLLQLTSGGSKPVIYFDNICSYDAEMPIFKYENQGINVLLKSNEEISPSGIADEDMLMNYMENTVALYVNQNTYAVDGEVMRLDEQNPNVKVYVENGRSFVPIRFVAEALDGGKDVEYNEAEKSAIISDDNHTIIFTDGSCTYTIDGVEKELEAPVRTKEGRMFVPVRAISEGFGKKVSYDKGGMIIIADRENFFDFREDLPVFRKLASDMIFRTPSSTWMIDQLRKNYPDNEHPRILLNKEKIKEIKNGIATVDIMAKWYDEVISVADAYLETDLLAYKLTDSSLLSVSRKARTVIQTLCFAYLMTDDVRYAERAYDEMENVCSFKDWNPRHFLDPSEMSEAVAIGYDWLYNYMTQRQRDTIRTALCRLGVDNVIEDYKDVPGRTRGYKWAQSAIGDNWNIVCNGAFIITSLAIADEEPDLVGYVLDSGMELIKKAILLYGPDGAWYEGPGYWDYATSYYTDFVAALYSVYGDTFGYTEVPGIAGTASYVEALTTPNGVFNFHDSGSNTVNSPSTFFLADICGTPALAQYRVEQMKNKNMTGTFRDLIWYNYHTSSGSMELELDYYFRDTEVASMRSNWTNESSVFLGVHAGKVAVYHGQMDIGQFIIDAYGTRYAADLGAESYNLGVSNSSLYRYRAEGHNVLVMNPDETGGQVYTAETVINRFESNEDCSLAVVDMTSAYSNYATSVVRGFKLTNNRSSIIIQDEIHTKEPVDLYWFMHTTCDIDVAEDGRSAVVKGKFRDMYVYLLNDVSGCFSVEDAVPFETSPVVPNQNKNVNYQKLVFHADNVKDATIPIAFSFDIPGISINDIYHPEVIPIDKWTLDPVVNIELPLLSNLTLNGQTVEGFKPETLTYSYRVNDGEEVPVVSAESGTGDVILKMPDDVPGSVIITVVSRENPEFKTNYVLKIDKEFLKDGPDNTKELSIIGVESGSVPQPENAPVNTLDGNLSTRWSAQGKSEIIYELSRESKVSYIGLAVYQDEIGSKRDGRKQRFDVYVSQNGINWVNCLKGAETSGTTLDVEMFPITPTNAKYIKVECNGTSVGSWNSITEFEAFGPKT